MSLPKISLDPAAPDTLYSGAQKINQAIDALDNHIQTTSQVIADLNSRVNAIDQAINNLDGDLAGHRASFAHVPYAVATGSANSYAVTITPAPPSYVEGMAIAVKIPVDNTGPSTLNVNGMGAVPIKKPNGNDVSAGNLKAGSIYTFRYNGTNFILQGEGGGGNAQPGDVLSGKTFTNDYGEQVGTMPNRGAMIITPGTSDIVIPAGYHNGAGYVKGDPNLVAANIKQGVSIFGVTGTVVQYKEASGSIFAGGGSQQVSNLDFTPKVVVIRLEPLNNPTYICYTIYTSAVGAIDGYTVGWLGPAIAGIGNSYLSVSSNGFKFRFPESGSVLPATAYWKAYGI